MRMLRRRWPIIVIVFVAGFAGMLVFSATLSAQAAASAPAQNPAWWAPLVTAGVAVVNLLGLIGSGIAAWVSRQVKTSVAGVRKDMGQLHKDVRGLTTEVAEMRDDVEIVDDNQKATASWTQATFILMGGEVRDGQKACIENHGQAASGRPDVVAPYTLQLPTFQPLTRRRRGAGHREVP